MLIKLAVELVFDIISSVSSYHVAACNKPQNNTSVIPKFGDSQNEAVFKYQLWEAGNPFREKFDCIVSIYKVFRQCQQTLFSLVV